LWPEQWEVWQLWCALDGRWLTASDMAGSRPVAIDLTQARALIKSLGLRGGRRAREFRIRSLLAMERAALAEMYPRTKA
jgi:hypothetical protein